MNIEEVKIEDLKPYEKNAKKHPKEQVQKIALSIERFGFNQPIVIDKENVVIVGHGRLEAGKSLGLKTVPALRLEGLTEDEIKAYRLADNKLNESGWDEDKLIPELHSLPIDLQGLTGFVLEKLSGGPSEPPEIQFTRELLEENNYIVFVFDNVVDWQAAESMFDLKSVDALDSKEGYRRMGIGRVIHGSRLINERK